MQHLCLTKVHLSHTGGKLASLGSTTNQPPPPPTTHRTHTTHYTLGREQCQPVPLATSYHLPSQSNSKVSIPSNNSSQASLVSSSITLRSRGTAAPLCVLAVLQECAREPCHDVIDLDIPERQVMKVSVYPPQRFIPCLPHTLPLA